MHMELHTITVLPAALTGVVVTFQNILTNVIAVVHLAKLIISADRKGPAFFHCLHALCVKLCSLYMNFRNRKNLLYVFDRSDVLLDLYLNRRCQPAFVLGMHTIVETHFAVTRLMIPAGSSILPPNRHQIYDVIARRQFFCKQHLFFSCGGNADMLTSGINAK